MARTYHPHPAHATSVPRANRSIGPQLRALLEIGAALLDPDTLAELAARPRTRGDCVGGERPCPWAGCRYHLALDVHPITGRVRLNHPDRELDELADTCALDVADRGPRSASEVAATLDITYERVRQIEQVGLRQLRAVRDHYGL